MLLCTIYQRLFRLKWEKALFLQFSDLFDPLSYACTGYEIAHNGIRRAHLNFKVLLGILWVEVEFSTVEQN